jgi:Fe2+ or Zn2+ uptake regulation protein
VGTEELVRLLAERGHRDSRPRRDVLDLICGWRGAFTAQAVVDRARPHGVGRATVFRSIALLQEAGVLVRLHDGAECSRYLLDRGGSDHHVVCTGCGTAAPLELGDVARALDRAAARAGFSVERHLLGAYGRCPACRPDG